MKFSEVDENQRYFRRCHFKGGGQTTTQTRNVPQQTANEASLESGLMKYNTTGMNNADSILNQAVSALNGTTNVDWSDLLNKYNSTMSDVGSGYNDVANGALPSTYSAARQQALNSDLNSTVGSAISALGSRGILNSSITNNALNNISQNASDTLAKQYSSDLSTQANLLNQKAGNASNVMAGNAAAEQNSYYKPTSLFNYASQLATPAQNMYNTMYSGRMNSAGMTTTQSGGGGSGAWGAVGSIGSSMIACFVGNTHVRTAHGYKRIADINLGDEVYSLDDNDQLCIEKVLQILTPHMRPIVEANFEDGTIIETTESQRIYTSPWFEYVGKMKKPAFTFSRDKVRLLNSIETDKQDLVYDIVVSGRNIFFADGIAVEGYGD